MGIYARFRALTTDLLQFLEELLELPWILWWNRLDIKDFSGEFA
jgi:hypothetical protein